MRLLWLGLLSITSVHAASNRTIDDVHGDSVIGALPVYNSSANAAWSAGPPCAACGLKPDQDKLFMGTWHDNSLVANAVGTNSITLSFTGTSSHIAV